MPSRQRSVRLLPSVSPRTTHQSHQQLSSPLYGFVWPTRNNAAECYAQRGGAPTGGVPGFGKGVPRSGASSSASLARPAFFQVHLQYMPHARAFVPSLVLVLALARAHVAYAADDATASRE